VTHSSSAGAGRGKAEQWTRQRRERRVQPPIRGREKCAAAKGLHAGRVAGRQGRRASGRQVDRCIASCLAEAEAVGFGLTRSVEG